MRPIPVPDLSDFDATKFWEKGKLSISGCLEWTGCKNIGGYGHLRVGKKLVVAHRVAFKISTGRDPISLVLHKCDNPACFNPNHLFEGNQTDNMRDMAKKGRSLAQAHPERLARGDRHRSRTCPESLKRGESHPMAKLTKQSVERIRAMVGISQSKIAAEFGVDRSLISQIRTGKIWKIN